MSRGINTYYLFCNAPEFFGGKCHDEAIAFMLSGMQNYGNASISKQARKCMKRRMLYSHSHQNSTFNLQLNCKYNFNLNVDII